jgi:hypothetical protein
MQDYIVKGYRSVGFVEWTIEIRAWSICDAMRRAAEGYPDLLEDQRITRVVIERDRP